MENFRIIKSTIILLGGMLLVILAIPFFLFAYSDETTHPALTDEIVDYFNRLYPGRALTTSQKELVNLGSIEEDEETRWLQHFYDPIYNRGLVIGPKEWEDSKSWSQNTLAQASEDGVWKDQTYGSLFSLFSSDSDFSWERAIYEYTWGDKNRAMLALGHVLHLIEDASVPDHTRNDPHPHITELFSTLNESPYESWTKKFTPENLQMTPEQLPVLFGSIENYFDSMAGYSNGNFFSKDTIVDSVYANPRINKETTRILSDGINYMFGVNTDEFDRDYFLVKIERKFLSRKTEYTLEDVDRLILTDYWSHLSKQAILHGAGVMKLFFNEVEKEKQTKILYYKNRSWWQKVGDGIAGLWAGFTNNTSSSAGLLATVNPAVVPAEEGETPSISVGRRTDTDADSEVLPPAAGEVSHNIAVATADEIPTELIALSLVSTESMAPFAESIAPSASLSTSRQ